MKGKRPVYNMSRCGSNTTKDKQMRESTDVKNSWIDGWMDEQRDGWMVRGTDGWMGMFIMSNIND